MAKVNDISVFGAEAIIANLEAIAGPIAQSAVRRGLYDGAVVLRNAARGKVPVRYGALKKAIVSETRLIKGTGMAGSKLEHQGVVTIAKKAFRMGPKGNVKTVERKKSKGRSYIKGDIYPRNYAHLVEFGTNPHMIGKRMHPGARAKPFMRPAFDEQLPAALEAFRNRLVAEVFKRNYKAAVRSASKAAAA